MRRLALCLLVLAAAASPAQAGGDFVDVAAGSRAVWVSGPGRVLRLDARTGRVDRRYILPALFPLDLAVGGGAAWVASVENGYTSGTVSRVELRTGVVRTIFRRERWPAQAVAITGDRVWVSFGSQLGRFDTSGRLLGVTPVERSGGWLAADRSSAWFCCHERRLLRIDSAGYRRASFTLPLADPIWTGAGSLWLDALSTLDRIDERTGLVLARIPLRSVVDLAASRDSVYALQDGALARIDAATNQVVALHRLPGNTQAVSVRPDGVWVTSVARSAPTERVFRLNPRTLAIERKVVLY